MRAYGNDLVHPFNFASDGTTLLQNNFTNASAFYQDLMIKGGAPSDFSDYNSSNSGYRSNGEASDWMLGK